VALVNGQARSATTLDTWAQGTYCWRAEYSGDANYQAANHTDTSLECFTTKPFDLCTEQPGRDLCTEPDAGPAACYAVAVHVRVAPGVLDPYALDVPLAPSSANASSLVGSAHGEGQVTGADALGLAGTRAGATTCDAANQGSATQACGTARLDNATVDLGPLGVEARLEAVVLREDACSSNGQAGFAFGTLRASLTLGDDPPIVLDLSQPRELNLSPLLHVWVNQTHQDVRGGCLRWHGSALRLRVYDPVGGVPPAAEVLIGWVDTLSCPVGLPPAPDSPPPAELPAGAAAACEATALRWSVTPGLSVLPGDGALRGSLGTAVASANAAGQAGRGDGQAALAELEPGVARASVLEGRCAASGAGVARANGNASLTNLDLDLRNLAPGINGWLHLDAVRQEAQSAGGVGASSMSLVGFRGAVAGVPLPTLGPSPEPQTLTLGQVRIFLNEQVVDPGPCPVHRGTALRVQVLSLDQQEVLAEVAIAEVAASSC
jgi:hypothetical protein